MKWKNYLPKGLDINRLTLDECRNFKDFYDLLNAPVGGPIGYQVFNRFKLHLLYYGLSCINDKKFPSLNKCWDSLSPHFLNDDYDNEWLVFFWMFCDFQLETGKSKTLIEYFGEFITENSLLNESEDVRIFNYFIDQMKRSRLGFYQEILSTKTVTKFKEMFTGNVISTVRSVPYYESGEIFLGRIVSYQDDNFLIHDPKNFPREVKDNLENMIKTKMFYIAESGCDSKDYQEFMLLSGPYLMSITHNDESCPIFSPDEYSYY